MAISKTVLIEQNNATVAFIQSQDFSRAYESSILALHHHRMLDRGESENQTSGSLDECMLLSAIDIEECAATSGCPFIYARGIRIAPTVIESASAVVTTILIFNTALAHQKLAEHHDLCYRTSMLKRAKHLYELAYEACNLDQDLLFQFAIINNIAVIEQDLGKESIANECFEYLMSLMIFFVDHGCELQLRHVKGFVANIPLPIKNAASA